MNGTDQKGKLPSAANADSKLQPVVAASTLSKLPPPTEIRIAVGSTNPCKLRAVQLAFERVLAPRLSSSTNKSSEDDDDDRKTPHLHLDIQGFHVPSLVSDQPKGDVETKTGAQNRARAAYQAYKEKFNKVPHFAVGLEGGIEIATRSTQTNVTLTTTATDEEQTMNNNNKDNDDDNQDVWCMAWMAIYGKRQALLADLVASSACHHYYGDKRPIFGLAKTASFVLPVAVATLIVKQGWELGDADDHVFGHKRNNKHGAGTVGILTDFLLPRADYYEHALLLALVPWIRPDLYPNGSR